jgi:uncharacterized protein
MLIDEMTEQQCRSALGRFDFGRLACARAEQPYIVPVNFCYDGQHVYGLTTSGQKIEWMRANPRVCLEVDERLSDREWMSVIVFGRFEELTDAPAHAAARSHALATLQRRELWWQPASVATELRGQRAPVFYRIHIERVSGRRATPDALEATLTS